MQKKSKQIKSIFLLYWFLLAYIIAALVWWYIALSRQNRQMTTYKLLRLDKNASDYNIGYQRIQNEYQRKTTQFMGEGSIFFLLIGAGAIFVYRAVNKELKITRQQQHLMMALTHELKTPIAVTKLNLETLQKRKLEEQQTKKLLQNTLQEANRMNALCNNMLLSSQMEAGGYRVTFEPIDMAELVQSCVMEFGSRYPEKKITTLSGEDCFTLGDQLLLQIALNNLVENAIKYSPKESILTITVKRNESEIELAVADLGSGIEEGEKKKVFQKFYRLGNEATKRARGTGLGLYLVNKIVMAHKGKIKITDNQPAGTIFSVSLPADEGNHL
jgi:K+-sensing histidine kinase KdpD